MRLIWINKHIIYIRGFRWGFGRGFRVGFEGGWVQNFVVYIKIFAPIPAKLQ